MAYAPIVQELVNTIYTKPGWASRFDQAIGEARKSAEKDYQDIQDLPDFFLFIDNHLKWVPRLTKGCYMDSILYQMAKFYFVLDQKSVYDLQTKIVPNNAQGPLSWLSTWLLKFALDMGNFMDTPESLTKESLQSIYRDQSYHMQDYLVPRSGWKCFNEFFARHVKPGTRPIDDICDAKVIVSPADSTFDGSWPVDDKGFVRFKDSKDACWNIDLLLQDSVHRDKFKNGKFMHAFLSTNDYHRQHAPVAGKVLEAKTIAGQVYLEVTTDKGRLLPVRPLPGNDRFDMHVQDQEGYQWCQMRGLIVLESAIGLVAILPIGMGHISSVVVTAEEGKELHKGEEISNFQFGGSDIVVVFQQDADVEFSAELHKHYNVGQKIATAGGL